MGISEPAREQPTVPTIHHAPSWSAVVALSAGGLSTLAPLAWIQPFEPIGMVGVVVQSFGAPLAIVGLVFGILAFNRGRQLGRREPGLGIASLVVGCLGILTQVAFIIAGIAGMAING